jgi:hypothetical protein
LREWLKGREAAIRLGVDQQFGPTVFQITQGEKLDEDSANGSNHGGFGSGDDGANGDSRAVQNQLGVSQYADGRPHHDQWLGLLQASGFA